MIEAADWQTAMVVLDSGRSRAIDAELAPAYRRMALEIRDLDRSGAYA